MSELVEMKWLVAISAWYPVSFFFIGWICGEGHERRKKILKKKKNTALPIRVADLTP